MVQYRSECSLDRLPTRGRQNVLNSAIPAQIGARTVETTIELGTARSTGRLPGAADTLRGRRGWAQRFATAQ